MKIKIYDAESKKKLVFLFPVSAVKWRFIWRYTGAEYKKYYKISKDIYKALKKYVRENGHFDLVDVDSNDGDRVKIRI